MLHADALIERTRLQSRVRRWRVMALVFAVIVIISFSGKILPQPHHMPQEPYIARIAIKGIIASDDEIIENLKKIAEDKQIKAVILHIDSPGGTATGGEIYYEYLKKIQSTKPLVVAMENIATSAGYLIATPADYILARRATITGSIGALVQIPDISELSNKIGVNLTVIKTGNLKGEPNPFAPATPEATAMLQGLVDDFQQVFTSVISEHRNIPLADVQKMADGRVFSGQQAVEHHLVDAIGGEDEGVIWLEKEKNIKGLNVHEYHLKEDLPEWAKLLKTESLTQHFLPNAISLNGLLSIWQNGAMF